MEDACRADGRERQGTKTELVPLVQFSAELLKGSARVKRSGSSREVSGDFSPSISFSVSEAERKDGESEFGGNRWQRQKRATRENFAYK